MRLIVLLCVLFTINLLAANAFDDMVIECVCRGEFSPQFHHNAFELKESFSDKEDTQMKMAEICVLFRGVIDGTMELEDTHPVHKERILNTDVVTIKLMEEDL